MKGTSLQHTRCSQTDNDTYYLQNNVKAKEGPKDRQGALCKITCCNCQATYTGETGRNLSTWLIDHKWVTENVELNKRNAEYHSKTNHTINWGSAACLTCCMTYYHLKAGIQTYTANAIEQLLPVSYTWKLIIIQTYAANYVEPLPSCALERITQQKTLTMYALVLSQHSTYCNRQLQTSSWKFHLINFVGSGPKIYFDRSMTPPLILQALERFVCFSRPSEIWKQLIIIILFSESLIYLPSCFLMCHCFVFSSFLFTGLGWKGIQCFLQQLFILFFDYWKTMKQHL